MRLVPFTIGLVLSLCLIFQAKEFYTSKTPFNPDYDKPIHYGRNSMAKIEVANHIDKMIRSKDGTSSKSFDQSHYTSEFLKIKKASSRKKSTLDALDWKERGPSNIGGRVRRFIVDQNDDSGKSWFVGTAGGGIWKTTSEGTTWANSSVGIPNLSVVALEQSQSNPQVIYAGTGENGLGGATSNGSGILKSTDGGSSWDILTATVLSNSGNFMNVNDLIVDPENADIVYAATSSGNYGQAFASAVMKSIDGGDTWSKLYSPEGAAQQLDADPNNFDVMYLSVLGSGIAKSTDRGETWTMTSLSDLIEKFTPGRTAFSIAPSNSDVIYASIGYAGRTGSGLFFTRDAGATWKMAQANTEIDFLVQGEYDNCIAVYPHDDMTVIWGGVNLYIGTIDLTETTTANTFLGADDSEISDFFELVSFNNGTHFGGRLAVTDSRNTPTIELRFGEGMSQKAHRFTVPTGSTSGVPDNDYAYKDYVSVPFEAWDVDNNRQLMVSFRDQEEDGSYSLNFPKDDVLSNSREYIYIHSLEYNENVPATEITKNGGQEMKQYLFMWPKLVVGGEWNNGDVPAGKFSIAFGEVEFTNVDVTNISDNNPGLHPDHHYLKFFNTGSVRRLVSTNDGGLAVSTNDGKNLFGRFNGLGVTQFYSATKKPGNKVYLGGTQDNDVLMSLEDPDNTSIWASQDPSVLADGFDVIFHSSSPDKILASYQLNNIIKTIDGGANWETSTNGLVDAGFNNSDAPFHTKFGHSKNNPNLVFAVSKSGIWKSSNFGGDWKLIAMEENEGWGGFYDIEVSDADPAVVWAGGGMDDDRNLFVSTDFGETFKKAKNYSLLSDLGNITTIVPDPNNAQTVYVTLSRTGEPKILKSKDLGETWEDISGFGENTESDNGYPDIATFCILPFPDGQTIWAGTELGLFESVDNGESWNHANNGFPFVLIWDMKVVDGEVVMATHGRGIWSVDLGLDYPNQVVLEANELKEAVAVIYPSPASSVLNIRFGHKSQTIESIRLHHINGQLVYENDLRGTLEETTIDISRFDRGLYLVSMRSVNGSSEQFKVIFN